LAHGARAHHQPYPPASPPRAERKRLFKYQAATMNFLPARSD